MCVCVCVCVCSLSFTSKHLFLVIWISLFLWTPCGAVEQPLQRPRSQTPGSRPAVLDRTHLLSLLFPAVVDAHYVGFFLYSGVFAEAEKNEQNKY